MEEMLNYVPPIKLVKPRAMLASNKSGYIDISHKTRSARWTASVRVDGKVIHLGTFKTRLEAIQMRNAYIIEHKLQNRHSVQPLLPEDKAQLNQLTAEQLLVKQPKGEQNSVNKAQ